MTDINLQALDYIENFRFVQNVENNEEYCSTGKCFGFIEGPTEFHLNQEEFNEKINSWMFDELIIYKAPTSEVASLQELYCFGNYLSSTNKEDWISQVENMTIETIPLSDEDFIETFGWGINVWLFDHRDIKINFPFDSATNKVQFFEETNPLFLGCEQGDHYYLFNYNGYI